MDTYSPFAERIEEQRRIDTANEMAREMKAVTEAKADWDALKNKLAALTEYHYGHYAYARDHGFAVACIEDAETAVLMLLEAVQRTIEGDAA